jgi:hypothetical protein
MERQAGAVELYSAEKSLIGNRVFRPVWRIRQGIFPLLRVSGFFDVFFFA